MQAIILAGGYGTRLYPLTFDLPKALIPIGEKCVIDHIFAKIDMLEDISDIFVISNARFSPLFREWREKIGRPDIHIIDDGTRTNEERLGALGSLNFLLQARNITEDVLIIGSDNIFAGDLGEMQGYFHQHGNTLALYDVGDRDAVRQFGHPTLDETGRITRFIEKPTEPTSTLCSTLIYFLRHQELARIPRLIEAGRADRAGDLIADIVDTGEIFGFPLTGKWFDIGTLAQLESAREYFCEGRE